MKKIIATLALCLMAATAFSQSSESMTLESGPTQFFSFEAFFAPSQYILTESDTTFIPKDDDGNKFKQLGLGITNFTPLSKKAHIYLNWGVGFVFSDYEWESEPYNFMGKEKTTEISYLYISGLYKANLGYLIRIPNTTIAFFPFGGLYGRAHIWGKCYTNYPDYDVEKNEIYTAKSEIGLFTKSDENPDPWNRFELGWDIGVKAFFGSFMVGLTYGKTFFDLTKDVRVAEFRLSAGLRF